MGRPTGLTEYWPHQAFDRGTFPRITTPASKAFCAMHKTKMAEEINGFIQRRITEVEEQGIV